MALFVSVPLDFQVRSVKRISMSVHPVLVKTMAHALIVWQTTPVSVQRDLTDPIVKTASTTAKFQTAHKMDTALTHLQGFFANAIVATTADTVI